MKIGIIGLANSGKTTIFNALTGQNVPTAVYPTTDGHPHEGVVKVPDERVDTLSQIFNPKKTIYATVHYVDYIGLTKGDPVQNRKVLDVIKDVDAVLHVVRCFEDESVVHPFGKVDPYTDVETVRMELLLSDLELVEKRLQRMDEAAKRGKKPDEKERHVLIKCKEALESEIPLREVELSEEETLSIRHLQFITTKPEVLVINLSEEDIGTERERNLIETLGKEGSCPVVSLSGKIEMEIAQLSEQDRKAFLEDLGLKEPAMHRVIRLCYKHLGLISFFTVVQQEVRAWTIKRGTTALNAAGKIHTDMQRGFIKAEVINYEDFISVGSMAEARKRGLLRLEGKSYEVRDGDIITFRFNI